jgi:asparagine synthase (glutamine-hydrolysing)
MCGICGLVRGDGVDETRLRRMVQALSHRGPDDQGVHVRGPIGLGHSRLSIIDLAGGHQPIPNEDRSKWVILNGEIYNYRSLQADLENRGHRFATGSDTEVIVHLYEEYGERCVEHLRGMFAFVIWDESAQRLFAARDHLGQKPFYYVQAGGDFAFASEIKALLADDPNLAEMDEHALDQYLSLRIITPPLSMFRKIRKLPPGHSLSFDFREGLRIQRYWDLEYDPKHTGSDEELADALEQEIVESLRLHVVSDVPIGAFLSGGLDSTLIVALLAKYVVKAPLKTFAGSLDYEEYDEAPYAKMVADQYGTDHHEQKIEPSLARLLPQLVWQLDEPSDPLSICSYLIAEMASKHVKVVLGGDGGDELFGGYDRYYGNRAAGIYASIPVWMRRRIAGPLLGLLPDGRWYKSRAHQAKWLHQLSFLDGPERYAASLGYFYFDRERRENLYSAEFASRVADTNPHQPIIDAYQRANAEHPIDRMLYADSQLRMPDHPVMILDRMTMAHGLEARSPLLDHRLAEFSARLPMRMKVRGRSLRYIETMLAKRHLPKELLTRPKQGFSVALPYMLRDEYSLLYRVFLEQSSLARNGIFRQAEVNRLIQEHQAGAADHGNRLWLILNAEVWFRMFIQGDSVEDLSGEIREAGHASGLSRNAASGGRSQ